MQKSVVFLEVPIVGQRVRILVGGQTATTSPVVNVQTDQTQPGWFCADTQSGSRYVGQIQNQQQTVFGTYQPTQYIPPAQANPLNNPLMSQSPYHSAQPYPEGLNWGAFLMAPWWGIAHNVWIALLAFLPPMTLVMQIVLLIKGNEWAWKNRPFLSYEQFYAVQRAWLIAGIIFAVLGIVFNFFLFFVAVPFLMALGSG